jgi:hypothetical protein
MLFRDLAELLAVGLFFAKFRADKFLFDYLHQARPVKDQE